MAEEIRFHLDEHMDPAIADALRSFGVDITTTSEQHLLGQEDETHLERSRSQARVVVTDDTDFLRLAAGRSDHAGVVFCRRTRHTLGEIIQFLLLIHGVCSSEEMRGRIEFL